MLRMAVWRFHSPLDWWNREKIAPTTTPSCNIRVCSEFCNLSSSDCSTVDSVKLVKWKNQGNRFKFQSKGSSMEANLSCLCVWQSILGTWLKHQCHSHRNPPIFTKGQAYAFEIFPNFSAPRHLCNISLSLSLSCSLSLSLSLSLSPTDPIERVTTSGALALRAVRILVWVVLQSKGLVSLSDLHLVYAFGQAHDFVVVELADEQGEQRTNSYL